MYLLSVDRLVHIAEDLGLTDGLIFAVYGQVLGLVELPKWAVHLLFTVLILFKNLEPAAQLEVAAEVHVENGVEEILLTFMSLVGMVQIDGVGGPEDNQGTEDNQPNHGRAEDNQEAEPGPENDESNKLFYFFTFFLVECIIVMKK